MPNSNSTVWWNSSVRGNKERKENMKTFFRFLAYADWADRLLLLMFFVGTLANMYLVVALYELRGEVCWRLFGVLQGILAMLCLVPLEGEWKEFIWVEKNPIKKVQFHDIFQWHQ